MSPLPRNTALLQPRPQRSKRSLRFVGALTCVACACIAAVIATNSVLAQVAPAPNADSRNADSPNTQSTEPSSKPAKPNVAKLIGELGDSSFAVRERASRELLRLGAASVPALQQATKSEDAEVRQRAQDLLAMIQNAPRERSLEGRAQGLEGREQGRGGVDSVEELRKWGEQLRGWNLEGPRVFRLAPFGVDPRADVGSGSEELRRLLEELEGFSESIRRVPGVRPRSFESGFEELDRLLRGDFDSLFGQLPNGSDTPNGGSSNGDFWGHFEVWRNGEKVEEGQLGSRAPQTRQTAHAELGVTLESVHPALRSQLSLAEDEGVVLASMSEGSVGKAAGLQQYDIVTRVQGTPIRSAVGFMSALRDLSADGSVVLEVIRKGERQSIELKLPARKIKYR